MDFNTISPIYLIIAVVLIVIFAICFMVVCVKLSNISYKINSISMREDEMKDLLTNMVQGSKRIERNVDAINQRTRAASSKKSSKIEKKGMVYDKNKVSKNKGAGIKRNSNPVRK